MTRHWLRSAAVSAALLSTSCRGSSERLGSALEVEMFGSAAAWQNVKKLEVASKDVELPMPVAAASQAGSINAHVFVCTGDRDRFLKGPDLTVRVTKTTGEVIESSVARVACRYSEDPGYLERLHIGLSESGSILSEFGEDEHGPWTSCDPPGTRWVCPVDEY